MSNVVTPPQTTNFRMAGDDAPTPTYLLGPVGTRYRYCLNIMYDALADGMGYAISAGMPSQAPLDALAYAGQDRLIVQGPSETVTSYIARLQQWLDLWRHAGTSTGIMLALLSVALPAQPEIRTVQSTGDGVYSQWDTYAGGVAPFPPGSSIPTPPYRQLVTYNWEWDQLSQPYYAPRIYWRQWAIIYSIAGSPWPTPTKTWGSFTWGDGTCYGWGGTAAQAAALSAQAGAFRSAGVWVPWVIVSYDATMFDPALAFGSSKLPDGHWGFYGKVTSDPTYGSVYVSARPAATTCTIISPPPPQSGPIGLG
jgi:hypothetical protein